MNVNEYSSVVFKFRVLMVMIAVFFLSFPLMNMVSFSGCFLVFLPGSAVGVLPNAQTFSVLP